VTAAFSPLARQPWALGQRILPLANGIYGK
jgi:hypothetical protein